MEIKTEYENIEIPEDMECFIEPIAKNIHNDWVRWRMELGFTYSEIQDYEKKTHPHVREWDDLPYEHKVSDYLAARSALKVLIASNAITTGW